MNVRVTIEVSTPPTASNLDKLRSAASELTNNLKSIVVSTDEDSKGFALITNFTMKTTTEYKVVDRISKEFKFWTFDLEGYREMISVYKFYCGEFLRTCLKSQRKALYINVLTELSHSARKAF